jgi:hypothetical protein
MKAALLGLTLNFTILVMLLAGCHGSGEEKARTVTDQESASQTHTLTDVELAKQVETFSTDVGDIGQRAWAKLRSYQCEDVLKSLLCLRDAVPKDDALQPQIAFVLCNLDYDYEANVNLITSAVSVKPPSGSGLAAIPSLALENVTLADALAEVERRMIADALRRHGGNISRAARELGLTRRGLYLKLERHSLSASA